MLHCCYCVGVGGGDNACFVEVFVTDVNQN